MLDKRPRRIPKKTAFFLVIAGIVLIVFVTGLIMLLTTGRSIKDSLVKMPFTAGSEYLTIGKNVIYSDSDMLYSADTSLKDEFGKSNFFRAI